MGIHGLPDTAEYHTIGPEIPEQNLDREPRGSQLIERFRSAFAFAEGAQVHPEDLTEAIDLVRAGVDDETATELLGSLDRLNRAAHEQGSEEMEPWLAGLKLAAYGDSGVQPIELNDQWEPEGRRAMLHNNHHTFEWTGMPITLEVPNGGSHETNPNSVVELSLGPGEQWYMRTGRNRPVPLEDNQPFTTGRAPHGSENDPRYVGMSNETSERQLTLTPMSHLGIDVRDHSTFGTSFRTRQYPKPSEYRSLQAMQQQVDQLHRAGDARHAIDRLGGDDRA